MDLGIKDRTAFITGGAGTLGLAVAQRLAREQARIVICDANEEAIARAVGILEGEGAHVLGCRADVTSRDEVGAAVARAQERFGGVDILVNNAGSTRDATLRKMDKAGWDAVLRTNLDSMFNVTKPFIDPMVERGWGRIVNVSSINGSKGQFGQTNYSAAKAGLIGFTRSLALESGKFGITANAVAPGVISTPRMRQRADYETLTERARQNTPVARLGDPEDVAATVAFLASTLAGFITGETVHVTGGRS